MHFDNDLLSIIFLLFIAIVITGVISNLIPYDVGLIIPTFGFICIALWIAYDYILQSRYNAKEQCMQKKYNNVLNNLKECKTKKDKSNDVIVLNKENDELVNKENDELVNKENEPIKITSQNKSEIDIDMYNGTRDIKQMHQDLGCSGDTMICNRMKYMGLQPQLAKDIRASFNKYTLKGIYEEELRQNADRIWWEDDPSLDELDLEF